MFCPVVVVAVFELIDEVASAREGCTCGEDSEVSASSLCPSGIVTHEVDEPKMRLKQHLPSPYATRTISMQYPALFDAATGGTVAVQAMIEVGTAGMSTSHPSHRL
jgi:hypothetical protein